jgi:hypothetical protein
MAYTQKPGRGNDKKTGRGISPMLMGGSPMYQEKKKDPYSGKTRAQLGQEIEDFGAENKRRVASEMIAKSDSTSAAGNAMKLDKTLSKKMAGRIGNEAANKTRAEKKIPKVTRGRSVPLGAAYSDPKNDDAYWRDSALDRDFPTSLLRAYGKSPVNQVSKEAFKKPAMTSTTTGPKASKKAPMKMKKC